VRRRSRSKNRPRQMWRVPASPPCAARLAACGTDAAGPRSDCCVSSVTIQKFCPRGLGATVKLQSITARDYTMDIFPWRLCFSPDSWRRHQPALRGTRSTLGPRSFHLKASLPANAPRALEPHPLPLSTWRPSPIRPSRRSLLASAAIPVAASHARPHPKNRCKLVPVLSATAAVSRRFHTFTHRPARRCGQEWGVKGNVHVWRNVRRVGRGERGRLWQRPREVRAELARVCACMSLRHDNKYLYNSARAPPLPLPRQRHRSCRRGPPSNTKTQGEQVAIE
jgi:hypothetical protein